MTLSIESIFNSPSPYADQIEGLMSKLSAETSKQQLADDTEKRIKELKNLLIEYILANMTCDPQKKDGLVAEIEKVVESVQKEAETDHQVQSTLSNISSNPSGWNKDTLILLENLQAQVASVLA